MASGGANMPSGSGKRDDNSRPDGWRQSDANDIEDNENAMRNPPHEHASGVDPRDEAIRLLDEDLFSMLSLSMQASCNFLQAQLRGHVKHVKNILEGHTLSPDANQAEDGPSDDMDCNSLPPNANPGLNVGPGAAMNSDAAAYNDQQPLTAPGAEGSEGIEALIDERLQSALTNTVRASMAISRMLACRSKD